MIDSCPLRPPVFACLLGDVAACKALRRVAAEGTTMVLEKPFGTTRGGAAAA